ncbi:MFS transporter [Streptomyces sp. NPDC008092]|uniref:MFS transporter n=1 Tax=Streptomyces sp. NPDC008092 TaxID=3364808 RepID=UPI0036EBFB25
MNDTGSVTPSPSDRMARVPVLTRLHYRWLVLLGLLLFFEQADLNTFAYAAPAIRQDWHLSIGDIGTITAASFLGMFVGSIFGGRAADRYGRKRVIVGATIFYSLCSLVSAFAVGVADLAVYRVLTGAGLQAMAVALITYVSEMFPARLRGRVQALILALSVLGIPAAAAFARWVTTYGSSAWRWIFVIGSAGIIVALMAMKLLPESVRWRSAPGRDSATEALVTRVEMYARSKTGRDLPPAMPTSVQPKGTPQELFRAPNLKRVVIVSVVLMLGVTVFYGFNAWIPTVLVQKGFTAAQSLTFSSIIALAGFPGALSAMLFIDRIERRTAIMLVTFGMAGLLLIFALVDDYAILLGAGFLMVLIMQASVACTATYLPEIFPTHLRALGSGIGNGLARLAVVGSSFLIAAVLAQAGVAAVFTLLCGAALLAAVVIGVFGERTRGRSLESIAGTMVVAAPARAKAQDGG